MRPRFGWGLLAALLAVAGFAVTSDAVPFGYVRGAGAVRDSIEAAREAEREVPPVVRARVADPARARLSGLTPETAPLRALDGASWVSVNDVARLLGASKFGRADLRRFELRARAHRMLLVVDNPFVLVDDATVLLAPPPRLLAGEVYVPISFIDRLPRDSSMARLVHVPSRDVVLQVPPSGIVGSPALAERGRETAVVFPADRPEAAVVASRARGHFRLRFDGFFVGELRDSTAVGLVRALRAIPTSGGCAFEFEVAPEAAGFRMSADRGRLTIVFTRTLGEGVEAFAPEVPPGPRKLDVVVLDPGHGGGDAGVQVGDLLEKDLTLSLAIALKDELEARTRARVLLTRGAGDAPSAAQRAEFSNRARADLVLSLHFDGVPGGIARGATAYCPPATYAAGSTPAGTDALGLQPWREVATRHAVESRAIAESVLSLLELRDQGPARLRELLPFPLLGVNAPGLMLECATLTSDKDRARLSDPAGVRALAVTIADGIVAYAKGE